MKDIETAIETACNIHERHALIVDPTGLAAKFLQYQRGAFLRAISPKDVSKENLRQVLVVCNLMILFIIIDVKFKLIL